MIRRIIQLDQEKCNGCGACAAACHESAIAMVGGKARLMRDDYCDGLGDCLPTCPTGAITFVEREAAAYDEQAVMENKQRKMRNEGMTLPCGCPGSQSRNIQRQDASAVEAPRAEQTSRLSQWPVQIKLVPVNAPYFDGARLLIAADCTAYAYSLLLDTGNVVILKRGETGYYKTDIPHTSKEEARALVEEYNRKLGVTRAQEEAMKGGSMFGFDKPIADPANYDAQGQPLKRREKDRGDTR